MRTDFICAGALDYWDFRGYNNPMTTDTCTFEECEQPVHIRKRGLCRRHYGQFQKGRPLTPYVPTEVHFKEECPVPGCVRPVHSKGLCNSHYGIGYRMSLTNEQVIELLSRTHCDMCGFEMERKCIDHDHACCPQSAQSCGACIRGVVCDGCNTMLGLVEARPERLGAVGPYLARGHVDLTS